MMIRHCVSAVAFLWMVQAASGNIDWTPRMISEDVDGVKFEIITFPSGEHGARISPSPAWKLLSGSAARATFNATDESNAQVIFESASAPVPRIMDDLNKLARSSVPPEAEVTSVESEPAWETMSTRSWRTSVKYTTDFGDYELRMITLPYEEMRVQFSLICESAVIDEKWGAFVDFVGVFSLDDVGPLTPVVIPAEEQP